MSRTRRRITNSVLACAVALVLVLGYLLYDISLYRHHHLSGWLMFYLICAQMFYYIQKRYEAVRQWVNVQWLPLHAEFGSISIVVLLVHVGLNLPDGPIGLFLLVCFFGVSVTGFVGFRIKRQYQDTLSSQSGKEADFDLIPSELLALQAEADRLMLDCAVRHKPSMLVDYYSDELSGCFSTPSNVLGQLTGNNQEWIAHFGKVEKLMPYLAPDESNCARSLIRLLRRKYNLDYHYAHQGALRVWLLIHVPFAFGLLFFTCLHILLVYAFSGGA